MIAVSATQRERREETPSRQVTFSQPCDMLHEPSLLWMQPWVPPTLIHTLVTSWITGSHVTWQAAWNSPVPVRSPSCTYVLQATTGPATLNSHFKPPIVSPRNNHILKSKVRDSKRSGTARRKEWWLAEAQWDNEASFKHLFLVQSPRRPLNKTLAARLSSCDLVDWSIHCEASWASYYEGKEGFDHFCIA